MKLKFGKYQALGDKIIGFVWCDTYLKISIGFVFWNYGVFVVWE